MKHFSKVLSYFLFTTIVAFSQKKVIKTYDTKFNEIPINTAGLDDIIIENSTNNKLEIFLYAENYDEQYIRYSQKNKEINVKFEFEGFETREVIFRKYITKRLQRANAIIKIPKNKKITIVGTNVDITSKSCDNDLAIYLDNGIVKLNSVQQNTFLQLFSGNVYGIANDIGIEVKSNLGKILVDAVSYEKTFENEVLNFSNLLKIVAIKANVFMQTEE